MKLSSLFLAASFLTPLAGAGQRGPEVPVLVELFTSEGCSSCPSADKLLAELEKNQPIPGARIVVLSEHVDYWNRLGWRDPFSSPEFTARQGQYASAFGQDGSYTPEAVVDGRKGFVGSSSRDAVAAIQDALKQPKADIKLTSAAQPGGVNLTIEVTGIPGSKDADIILAITETGLQSQVTSGENGGRLLRHTGVVRRIAVLGRAKESSYSTQTSVAIPRDWKRQNLQAIVFVQDRKTKHILGTATAGEMQPQYSRLR